MKKTLNLRLSIICASPVQLITDLSECHCCNLQVQFAKLACPQTFPQHTNSVQRAMLPTHTISRGDLKRCHHTTVLPWHSNLLLVLCNAINGWEIFPSR
jgi:hypothetical protein